MKSEKQGALKKIFMIIILVLLLTIVIITAQNINEELQTNTETQTTETETENTLIDTNSQISTDIQDDNSKTTNEINTETNTESIKDLCKGINCEVSTLTCLDGFIATCENSCDSEIGTCTSCSPSCEGHEQITEQNQTEVGINETIKEAENNTETTNETILENITIPSTGLENKTETPLETGEAIGTETPQIDILISYPFKITRGEVTEIKVIITNFGAKAKNVFVNWFLPQDFEIISGNLIENCGNLNAGETCVSIINIQTSSSTLLGKNQIKVTTSYEK